MLDAELRQRIEAELRRSGPLTLRAIAGRMYRLEYPPVDLIRTSRVLKRLCRRTKGRIKSEPFPIYGKREPTQVYSIRKLTPSQRNRFISLLDAEKRLLVGPQLKAAGERYVKALFTKTRRFRVQHEVRIQMTRRRADLLLTDADAEQTFVVEVKNQHKSFDSESYELAILLRKAIVLDAVPVLAASFITADGKRLCRKLGIAIVEFGRQFIPAVARTSSDEPAPKQALKKLRSVLHPELFELVPVRPFQNTMTERARADFKMVDDPLWASKTERRWFRIRATIKRRLGRMWPDNKTEQDGWPQLSQLIENDLKDQDLWISRL